MALITCPECTKQISESALSCPNCGYPIVKETSLSHEPQQVEVTSINLNPTSRNNLRNILIGVFVILLITGIIFGFIAFKNAQKAIIVRNSYIGNLNLVSFSMATGAKDAEEICDLTANVWHNTVYEKIKYETMKYTLAPNGLFNSDFNTSLAKLFTDEDIKKKVKDIELNQIIVSNTMKDLKNPTLEFQKCYDTLNELFGVYMSLTELAIHPSGSLQTFTQSKSEKTDKFIGYFRMFGTQIPEKDENLNTYKEFLKIIKIK